MFFCQNEVTTVAYTTVLRKMPACFRRLVCATLLIYSSIHRRQRLEGHYAYISYDNVSSYYIFSSESDILTSFIHSPYEKWPALLRRFINVFQPFYTLYLAWYPSLLGIFQHLSYNVTLKLCDTRFQVKYALEYTLAKKWPVVLRRLNTRNALWTTPLWKIRWDVNDPPFLVSILNVFQLHLYTMKQMLCYTRASREYFNSFHTSYWTVTYSALEHTLETNDPPFLGGSILAMHFELFRFGIYAGKKMTCLL